MAPSRPDDGAVPSPAPARREAIRLRGTVQGVGMRPAVFTLARRFGLAGFVRNDGAGVTIEVEGDAIEAFAAALAAEAPPLARIDTIERSRIPPRGHGGFVIAESAGTGAAAIPADTAPCDDCLDEMFDPHGRFFLYPFTTCTRCGPRFTITRQGPYDRRNTAMDRFAPCPACARDYADPANRRFHAETIACPDCGPRLSHPIEAIAAALRAGRIVAVKGIGGFQLMCDATDRAAVATLRARKRRAAKPFAAMVANLAALDGFARPDPAERDLIATPSRPIVLMPARPGRLAAGVAPGLDRVGLMLPSSPLHYLLFHALAGRPEGWDWRGHDLPVALVATSANPGGEPLVIDDDEARRRLVGIADLIVTHDRPIVARADDAVMMVQDGAPALIRRGRGQVPDPIGLDGDGPCVLGLGAHLKTTLTLTRGCQAFVSQHVGDLDDIETDRFHRDALDHLTRLVGARPLRVACDLHPDYRSTRLALSLGLPVLRVQHHAAHVAAVAAEHRLRGPVLGVALDGHGLGDDGGNWGGEMMLVTGPSWLRIGHLRPLPLPGGDRAAREPWRMAAAALAEIGQGERIAARFATIALAAPLAATIDRAPRTTSLGRLFDAAAGLLGLCPCQDYEGQAAMELESLVSAPRPAAGGFALADGILDFTPLLAILAEPGLDPRLGADLFHGTLIDGLAAWIGEAAPRLGHATVALGGGCLANRVLAGGLTAALRARAITPLLARQVPCGDGGLSLGQAAMARALAG